ncbi:MAG: transcriptional regulator [Rhodospirillales bacterium RIFCSPLOWO2_12_FULL_58_28]|nr:MAG: transcriptional regulator [Rhodospirillales bacterium RIFCSPLOWO2_02_FULL_58_16]OHC77921.1 MAG: transcriptional regulator [Rhodospirillales bacterium RIFCSPLOWO2_12_FULL_58_28]
MKEPKQISYVAIAEQFADERDDIMPIIESVLAGGNYVGGPAIDRLEEEVARFVGVKHCVALNSGTDALMLGMKCLGIGPGDEVITPPNSFIASTAAIANLGAVPVFVDAGPDQNIDVSLIEAAITPKTRAIMPVHLTGRVCDMDPVLALADKHGLTVIEDAAQAMGAAYKGRRAGSIGNVGCFSAHPLKIFNSCGDGGLATTNDDKIAERIRHLRNHGLIDRDTVVEFGYVSRMDVLQAEILRYRLPRLGRTIAIRKRNAAVYRELLDPNYAFIPPAKDYEDNTFTMFVAQFDRRDELQSYLKDNGVATGVHYPTPIHLQPAARRYGGKPGDFPVIERQSKRILSLPHHQFLTEDQIRHISGLVNAFFRDYAGGLNY